MPGSCDTINEWVSMEEQRQAQALDALNLATENATLAVASLAAANTWAASCNVLIVDPVAYAVCEVPAVAAVAAATYAVTYYRDEAQAASQAYKDIQSALETLHKLLESCEVAATEQRDSDVDSAIADAQTAFSTAEAVTIPDVSADPLSTATTAVATAEDATTQAQEKQREDSATA